MNESPFNPEHQNRHTDSRIVAALERISEVFRVLLWNESKESGLSPIQIQILIHLHFFPERYHRITMLANEFNLTKATVSDSVRMLEEKGLVKKTADETDSRSMVLRLTAKGEKLASQFSLFASEIEKPVSRLSPGDKESLLNSLLQVIDHLNRAGIINVQRMCFSCTHYHKKGQTGHFCSLMNKSLQTSDIRLNCLEYEAAEG
jgi:DNA-binding MarR family transcriptional regulator